MTYAPLRNPFEGARLFVDRDTAAARWQRDTPGSGGLDPITTTPQARWVNGPADLAPVPALARRAGQRGELLVVVAYWIPDRGCAGHREGAPTEAAYLRWVRQLAGALGRTPAVVVLEPDAVPADCFGPARAAQLAGAVRTLSAAGRARPGRRVVQPARQGLGVAPTTRTGQPAVDALLWIKRPGESDGICGGEDTYLFSPRQARTLIANGAGVPVPVRRAAAAADIPARGD